MQKPGLFGMNGVLIFLLSLMAVGARAQQPGSLILIDAENKQAFTIRLGDDLYASSGHGHLVLPHLKDSTYRLNLRFPKKNIPELTFPVTVHQKDLGFQLRGNDTTWMLYNWQTREIIHPLRETDSTRILDRGVKRTDGFSQLMAAVVNDTSVMYNTYTAAATVHADTIQKAPINVQKPVLAGGSVRQANLSATQTTPAGVTGAENGTQLLSAGAPVTAASAPDPSEKRRIKDSINAAAKAATTARKDSIQNTRKLAALMKDSLAAAGKAALAARKDSLAAAKKIANNTKDSTQTGVKPTVRGNDSAMTKVPAATGLPPAGILQGSGKAGVKKLREVSLKISRKIVFLDTGPDGISDTVTVFVYFETGDTAVRKPAVATVPASPKKQPADSLSHNPVPVAVKPILKPAGPQCSQLASDEDLESVRSAILIANAEQEKIAVASGAFMMKCFTVAQIRVLAGLFVSDKARFRLMDAARQHISDSDHFRELADMYTDKNFQKKFLQIADKRS